MTAPASSAPPDLDAIIQRRIRQDVLSMHAYAIQDSRGLIKLDAMENPFRLPPDLQREMADLVAGSDFHLLRAASHLAMLSHAPAFAEALMAFLVRIGHV